ncbi:hypothetical protein PHYBOEH_006509 [Phytophthora boehmeriae]|uniref:Ig-like domain-containing protein n=1 Tax=Phytophthora boehmeriae TaxID=109152 RepID=A0A8T1WJB9_9STRA|nr:hypothetical protein PHYBOEH_006509 [Phytophthora boehmeriae]
MLVIWGLLLSLGLLNRCAALLEDAQGLQFADSASFCSFHCSSASLSQSSQCPASLCGTRRVLSDVDQQQINVLTCNQVAQNASMLAFSLTLSAADSVQVFRDFHDAFFQAFDAMFGGDSIKADACQLAFLQDKLLPDFKDEDSAREEAEEHKPRLVKLQSGQEDEDRECIVAVRDIWGTDEETPLMTRRGDRLGESTVLLVHANASIAERLRGLTCVDTVLDLPAILKLMPFARSAAQLSARMAQQADANTTVAAPAMEIRLVDDADREVVLTSLQQRARELFGLLNVFETSDNQPRSIFTKSLQDLRTWTNILAIAVVESSVEWIDERHEITQNLLRGEDQKRWSQMQSHRRLDAYAPSLVGVDSARQAGIRGNDVVVGITDTGLYLYHDQFDQDERDIFSGVMLSARKVVMYNAWANKADESESITCGHGTHVAGLLAGSSFSGKHDDLGIANKAQIAFMDIGTQSESCAGRLNCGVSLATPADASDLLESQMDAGATIFSFSWGTPGSDYSAQARDLDKFIHENPNVLLIVAAGNSGESSTTGQSTISSPSGAKNVISVGASLNNAASFTDFPCPDIFNERTVASFSSAGPTTDGRLKPDVVAPGMSLISSQSEAPGSTKQSSATCSLQGTSQATPVVTGVAVLLFEWLRDGWWKSGSKDAAYAMKTVPAALLKALIIHSGDSLRQRMGALPASGVVSCTSLAADAIEVTYPDMYQGYGKPNLTNIVDFLGQDASVNSSNSNGSTSPPSLYFLPNSTEGSEPTVRHGGNVVISFTVAKDVDLRATLVWTDPPGSTQASSQLQHDLDLVVRVRNGTQTFGPLTADSSTGRDSKNNVEMVQVSYQDLLAAASGDNTSSSNATLGNSALGDDGEIIVEAVIYGRSVLLADTQAFAFVASSSAIGSTSGSAAATSDSDSFCHSGTPAAPVDSYLLPRHTFPSHASKVSPVRRWKRFLLLSCVLYTIVIFFWFVRIARDQVTGDDSAYNHGNFISAVDLDAAQESYLHAHEDHELQPEFDFATLESKFMRSANVSVEQDESEVVEAEAHAKTIKDFPVSEAKMRKLRCVSWRATDGCNPSGRRLPSLDEPCSKVIPFGASGYCEVQDKDTGERFRVMQRYCSSVRDTARFRCSDAWDFAVFPQKARDAVKSALNQEFVLPNIDKKAVWEQKPHDGIVMVVYPKLLASAYATIRALRELLDCPLPVELWFRPQEMKHFPTAFAQLQQWSQGSNSITFREINQPGVTGFATKVFAMYHSSFERVLFLDADNTPVRDPTFLFESQAFAKTGAVFWPDFWHPGRTIFNLQPHSLVWELLDLPFISMFEQESGQLLIDRRRHAAPLELVKFFAFHRPNHFDKMKLAHGDKDLFRFAWLKLGAPFHMIATPPAVAGKVVNGSFCGMTMAQYDTQGDVLFLHRNSHKLMGVPRRKATNNNPAALRRAHNKKLRMQMARADRITVHGEEPSAELEDTPSPTLEAPEADGYPDMAIWTHLASFNNTSRRSDYYIGTYTADPDFEKGQNCYGIRYLNQTQHFVAQEFADLSFTGLESELRRFAMEGAQFYEQAGITGR